MHALTGYADRWSVRQGDAIRFMVSSAGGRDFALRFVRHICADPNPAGPGYAEIPMASAIDGTHAGKEQHAYLGSFGHVASLPVDLRGGVCLSATIWPTTPGKGRQGLIALRIDGWTLALGIGPGGGAMAEVAGPDGACVRAEVSRRLLERRWYDVTATLGIDGDLTVTQTPRAPLGDAGEARTTGSAPACRHAGGFPRGVATRGRRTGRLPLQRQAGTPRHPSPGAVERHAGGVGFLDRHPDPVRHRYRPARSPCPPRQPAHTRHDGIELDRRGARLESRSRPIRRDPFPRRRPRPAGLERKRLPQRPAGLAQRLLRRPYQQRCRRGLHPFHRAAAAAAGGGCAAGADVQLPGLRLLRPPWPRRRNRRARRSVGSAARDARHEPAIRTVLLQRTQRRLRRVAGHAVPSDAGHATAAVRADGSGRRRIGHGTLGGRQLHRPVPVHHRHGARRHHRPRPARRGRRRAGAVSRRHRRAASGVPLGAHDAGVRGFSRPGRAPDVSRRQRLLLARRTVAGSARHA